MSTTVEEGERLQAAAYATGTIQPAGLGPAIIGLMIFFSLLSFVITGLRCWVRFCSEQRWGWDDIIAVGGYVAFVPSNVFGILASYYGLGAPDELVTELLQIRALEYFMYYEILYFAASSSTKISVTLTVLRLCDKQVILRRIAIANAVMMMTAAGAAGAFVLTNCRPFDTYWNPDLGVCTFGEKGLGALEVISIIGSSFQALSDWVSAILPFFLIKDLVMPRRTKIALICILGLGVMASIAALVRMGYYHHWSDDKGLMYNTGVIVITSQLEIGLGIVACSLPPLRRLLKNAFSSASRSRAGLSGRDASGKFGHLNLPSGGGKMLSGEHAAGGAHSHGPGTPLATLQVSAQGASKSGKAVRLSKGEWSRLDDDSLNGELPERVIVRETRIQVSYESK